MGNEREGGWRRQVSFALYQERREPGEGSAGAGGAAKFEWLVSRGGGRSVFAIGGTDWFPVVGGARAEEDKADCTLREPVARCCKANASMASHNWPVTNLSVHRLLTNR